MGGCGEGTDSINDSYHNIDLLTDTQTHPHHPHRPVSLLPNHRLAFPSHSNAASEGKSSAAVMLPPNHKPQDMIVIRRETGKGKKTNTNEWKMSVGVDDKLKKGNANDYKTDWKIRLTYREQPGKENTSTNEWKVSVGVDDKWKKTNVKTYKTD